MPKTLDAPTRGALRNKLEAIRVEFEDQFFKWKSAEAEAAKSKARTVQLEAAYNGIAGILGPDIAKLSIDVFDAKNRQE